VLNVLSIPSSTGEEPYSIAMALMDLVLPDPFRFRVHAVDISMNALRHARAGVYGKGSFRGRQLEYRDRYFTRTDSGFVISDDVRQYVDFKHGNVLEGSAGERSYDVVFCRNLLIYFDAEHQRRAMDRLTGLTNAGGLMFLGPAETFLTTGTSLRAIGAPMSFGFRKTPATTDAVTGTRGVDPARTPAARSAPPKSSSGRTRSSQRAAAPPPPRAKQGARQNTQTQPGPVAPEQSASESRTAIEALANTGRLAEAAQACVNHLATHGADADVLFLLGVVSDSMGDRQRALATFRKVLYLNPGHEGALMHMSVLARDGGGADRARHLINRAESIRRGQDPDGREG
jgi:chemotaxis protein methyltransferase WspC